jgi:hypothetical protein
MIRAPRTADPVTTYRARALSTRPTAFLYYEVVFLFL